MEKKIDVIEITQPIGTFYVGKMNSKDLVNCFYVRSRNDEDGIQRLTSIRRVNEIESYCKDPDAAFPTPIILSVDSSKIKKFDYSENSIISTVSYENSKEIFEIIDGQHRVKGIKQAQNSFDFECELLVVLMFDLTEEEKAYIFSTINSNQAKVNKSLIYDLFELSTERSPLKTCHYIARIMNSKEYSPFYQRLKMLGKKESEFSTLSQGTFVNGLVKLISSNPQRDMIRIKNGEKLPNEDLVFRSLFVNEQDDIILKIIKNYFGAVKEIFNDEWNSSKYILTKTTGYFGLIDSFSYFYNIGIKEGKLNQEFFEEIFKKIKIEFNKNGIQFMSNEFSSGVIGQKKLKDALIKAYENQKI
ncbi:MAG: DGQHR domain-containing protein [Erysipelotrichaceae bacterium]|nr:DGQHR domain-containing protein [Erysipelotrichaceae bacterium]